MYKQTEKSKEGKNKSVANSISKKKGCGTFCHQIIDKRKKNTHFRNISQLIKKNHIGSGIIKKANIIQRVQILPLQNRRTAKEVQDINDGAKLYNAQVIWAWLPHEKLNIGDNEDLFLVTHGNTESIGDENPGEKFRIDYTPQQAAIMLDNILPSTYFGKIWLWACHGSDKKGGEMSVAEGIMTNLSRIRKKSEAMKKMKLIAFPGDLDSKMDLTKTMTTIKGVERAARKRMSTFKYVYGKNRNKLGGRNQWNRKYLNLSKRLTSSKKKYLQKILLAKTPKEKRRLRELYRAQWIYSRSKGENLLYNI